MVMEEVSVCFAAVLGPHDKNAQQRGLTKRADFGLISGISPCFVACMNLTYFQDFVSGKVYIRF